MVNKHFGFYKMMNENNDIKHFEEFNDYYIGTSASVRSKNPDFHIFRFNELGNRLVEKQVIFKTAYYQFALGASLSSNISVFNKSFIAEEYAMVIFIPGQIIKWERTVCGMVM